MDLVEVGVALMKILVPPKADDADGQQRWRWVVFSGMISLVIALTAHIALACGWVPYYPGFALASETQSIQRRVDVIATLALEREMRSKALELCTEKDHERRNELNDDLTRLQREYREITQQWYAIPGCDKL